MPELQPAHGWRFSLRTLLILTAIAALATYNWKFFYYLGVAGQLGAVFWTVFFVSAAIAWNLGQSAPPQLKLGIGRARPLALFLLVILAACALYLVWTTSRWHSLIFSYNPRPFPYPDRLLMALHEYLDRLSPAGAGYIKIHGEIDKVYLLINYSAWSSAAMVAFNVGLLFHVDRGAIIRRVAGVMRRVLRQV